MWGCVGSATLKIILVTTYQGKWAEVGVCRKCNVDSSDMDSCLSNASRKAHTQSVRIKL